MNNMLQLNMKEKKRYLSFIVLFSMLFQLLVLAIPQTVYATSNSSIEVVVKDESDNTIPGAEITIQRTGGGRLSFIKENGVYKVDPSGFFKEVSTDNNGSVIISNLDIGAYSVNYMKSGAVNESTTVSINTKSDFKRVDISLKADQQGANNSQQTQDAEEVREDALTLKFNSEGSSYTITNANNAKIGFTKTSKGYVVGGRNTEIKSSGSVNIYGLKAGRYTIRGQGKTFRINYNGKSASFSIADAGETITNNTPSSGSTDFGSMEISINDRKKDRLYRGAIFEIVDRNNNPVYFDRVSSTTYEYAEDGPVDEFVYNGRDIKLRGLPVNDYKIRDTTGDDFEFDTTFVEIIKNKTAIVEIQKGEIERDLILKTYIEKDLLEDDIDEEDDSSGKSKKKEKKVYLDDFIFNLKTEDGETLKFSKEDDDLYVYDKDGKANIIGQKKGVEITGIPHDKVHLMLKESPDKYEDEVEDIEIDLSKDNEFEFKASLKEYLLDIKNEDDKAIEGVLLSIEQDGKEVSRSMSDKEGLVKINNIDPEEDYEIKVLSVPSPYSLPNQGKGITGYVENKHLILDTEDISNDLIDKGSLTKDEPKKEDKEDSKESIMDRIDENEPINEISLEYEDEEIEDEENIKGNTLYIPFARFVAKTSANKEGAMFSFVDKNGEEIYRLVTEENGEIEIPKINHGEYVVTQLTVADGHKIDEEKYKLVIDGEYISERYTFNNPKIGESDLEDIENDKPFPTEILIAAILLSGLAGYIYYRKKYIEEDFDDEIEFMSEDEIKALDEGDDPDQEKDLDNSNENADENKDK